MNNITDEQIKGAIAYCMEHPIGGIFLDNLMSNIDTYYHYLQENQKDNKNTDLSQVILDSKFKTEDEAFKSIPHFQNISISPQSEIGRSNFKHLVNIVKHKLAEFKEGKLHTDLISDINIESAIYKAKNNRSNLQKDLDAMTTEIVYNLVQTAKEIYEKQNKADDEKKEKEDNYSEKTPMETVKDIA